MRKTVDEWLSSHKQDKRSPKTKLPGQKRAKRPPVPQPDAAQKPPRRRKRKPRPK